MKTDITHTPYQEEWDNTPIFSQEEIDSILAEYKHQQLFEHLVGPLTSMIVHVAGVLLVVIMISTNISHPRSPTTISMVTPQDATKIEELEPFDKPKIEEVIPDIQVPEIEISPPSDNASGSSAGDLSEPMGKMFTIPNNSSPFKLNIPVGNGQGNFGFGNHGKEDGKNTGKGTHSGDDVPYLNGRFYDLKRTSNQQAVTTNNDTYCKVMNDYMHYLTTKKGVNPIIRFYMAERNGKPVTLRTGGLYFKYGKNRAAEAPRAFGVEKIVRPSQWIAHYQGILVIGKDCECRFWGEGDDFISVLVDNKPILVTGYWDPARYGVPTFKATEQRKGTMNGRGLEGGYWISLKKGQKIKLDILFGEIPGGGFGGMLLVEKRGETYEIGHNNNPKFPLFTTVEILEDQPPKGEIAEAAKDGLFALTGGMLTKTSMDVFIERLTAQNLSFY